MKSFRDKLVVVTGASSGIGEAIAVAFAREGAKLVLTARDAGRLDRVRAQCESFGASTSVHCADLTDQAQVKAFAERVHAQHRAIDILVNNAGVVMGGYCWEVESADWRRLHEINVMGVVHGIAAFVPNMIERDQGGHIVNMASVSGYVGAPGMGTYSASKFAVVGLTESLRSELHRHRIGVTAVCPGFVKTPIQEKVKLVGQLDSVRSRARVARDFERTTLLPAMVAERTLKAIRRNEAIANIGRDAFFAKSLKRWAPSLLERALRK